MSYKEFIGDLPDDVTPAAAQQLYEEYKVKFYGSRRRVHWEEHKEEDELRNQYDPRRLQAACEARNEEARTACGEFAQTKLDGNPTGNGADADMDMDVGGSTGTPSKAPALAGTEPRIAQDVSLAVQLATKLDEEKGIVENRVLNPDLAMEPTERLDLLLDYLWNVHAVDYYASKELLASEYGSRKTRSRTVRPSPPASAVGEPLASSSDDEAWAQALTEHWQSRADGTRAGPTESRIQAERVEKEVEAFVEAQIIKIEEGKYGCKLSQKLFIGPDFVKKHVRVKHAGVVEEFRNKLLDDVYRENYLEATRDQVPEDPGTVPPLPFGVPSMGGPMMVPPVGFPGPGGVPMGMQGPVGIPALDRVRQRYVDLDTTVPDRPVLDYGDL